MSIFSFFFRSFFFKSSALSYFGGRRSTVIRDENDEPLSSKFNGQRFVLNKGDESLVYGDPVLTIDNDRVSFKNRGTAETTGDTATIDVQGDKARINNQRRGEILAEHTGVEVSGEHVTINNRGLIDGGLNGVNFVKGGESSGRLNNYGTIQSDSQAVGIGGDGVTINNHGHILGTDDQRNGTIHADGTAEDFRILNGRYGRIDAGEGNDGAGVALETGDHSGDVVRARVTNKGVIEGRGQAAPDSGLAGDGIRIFSGVEGGGTAFRGSLFNSGKILSESEQGSTAAIRISDGLNFEGRITNTRRGLIDGANNGVYFGDGEHNAEVVNYGRIQSDSRAVNIDGSGVELMNHGRILGTGDQRNGTVHADATADDYSITNGRWGRIDAGRGNDGAGVVLQTGDEDGDSVDADILNQGKIVGRGDGEGDLTGDGVRLVTGVDGEVVFQGDIENRGRIVSEEAAGIRIGEGVALDGQIRNYGTIEGAVAIDASEAAGDVEVINHGTLIGDVLLSEGDDRLDSSYGGTIHGTVFGNGGDDAILAGDGDDVLVGGLGDDRLDGARGNDTARFDDIDVGVEVNLAAGEATRETGFKLTIEDLALVNPNLDLNGVSPADIVQEGADGNLYFNIHTSDFPAGELRGNLVEVVSDKTVGGVRTLVLRAELNGESEVQAEPVETDASGSGTVTFVVEAHGSVTYSVDLEVSGLNSADLLPVNIGNGTLSPIHLHNAPPNANGPVVTDVATDAGFDVANGEDAFALAAGFELITETDELSDIETVVGSDDDDILLGNAGGSADTLIGGAGDDTLAGGGGSDVIDGGEGSDTNSFFNINATAPDPTVAGVDVVLNADGSGTAQYNVVATGGSVSESFSGIENIIGTVNDDRIVANGAAANVIEGGDGNDFIAGGGGVDVLSGGDGIDTNSFITIGAPTAEIIADLATGNASYQPNVEAGVTVFERFDGFENLDGSNQSDQLFGDGGANVLTGNGGADLLVGRGGADDLRGGDGNDVLQGGGGTDSIDGGKGIDTNSFNDINVNAPHPAAAGVTATVANDGSGTARYTVAQGPNAGAVINETFSNIENLSGSENEDSLTGNDGDNLLAGGLGSDHLVGGGGDDVLRGDEIGAGTAVVVSATNELAPGGTFLTPLWFGFHDGADFDLFNTGEAASAGLERLAEDGNVEGIAAEFNAQVGPNGSDATILGANGFIAPGETASQVLDIPEPAGQAFFTWASMVIPSNDAFLAVPDDALADPLFDEDGNFLGLTIERRGEDVLDAGTEVNNELDAAFLNQAAPDTGTDENGVIGSHPGFNGSAGNPGGTPVNVLDPNGAQTPGGVLDPAEADFTADDDLLLTITVERLASFGVSDTLDGGAGEDTLDGGGGRDVLTGGTEADTFVFIRGTDEDTVTDYEDGIDRLQVSEFFDDAADAVAAARQDGSDTVIDLDAGAGDAIRLTGIHVGDIDETDFIV